MTEGPVIALEDRASAERRLFSPVGGAQSRRYPRRVLAVDAARRAHS